MKFHTGLAVIAGLILVYCSAPATTAATTGGAAKVALKILKNLQESPTTNILVTFKKANTKEVLTRFDSLALASRNAKLNTLYNVLKDHTDSIQENVISMLKGTQVTNNKKFNLRPLWMTAELIIRGVDLATVELLGNHPDVESLVAERFIELEPVERRELAPFEVSPQAQWGIDMIHAEDAHRLGHRGQGVVVANIDTGVRYTHVALNSNFRGTLQGNDGNYAWYDPSGGSELPSDGDGHGTHTMGTIAGTQNHIGVAPNATWIACKGCTGSCSFFDLTECGNWMGCPTFTNGSNPDCTKAPNLVSNSWGGSQGDAWYDPIMTVWRRAEIAPIFSAGNSGPDCRSATSPGDSALAISIGATDLTENLTVFSSFGPSITFPSSIKPNYVAPGLNIVSASSNTDGGYATMSGTSMASPHAAGVAAVILSQKPGISIAELEAALTKGAQHTVAKTGQNCGTIDENTFPNNAVGHGRLDALASVQ